MYVPMHMCLSVSMSQSLSSLSLCIYVWIYFICMHGRYTHVCTHAYIHLITQLRSSCTKFSLCVPGTSNVWINALPACLGSGTNRMLWVLQVAGRAADRLTKKPSNEMDPTERLTSGRKIIPPWSPMSILIIALLSVILSYIEAKPHWPPSIS